MRTKLAERLSEAMSRLEGLDPKLDKDTLLVVDDEKGPRESLRMILSPQHNVISAENADEAMQILHRQPVDAITIDLNMPGTKGDQLMRRVRSEFPHVEVIIITGCSSVETAVDGIRHGVFDYLTKPFDVVEVSSTVRRALARKRNREQLLGFLRGIASVLGNDTKPELALRELGDDEDLQQRLRSALADPILAPCAERERETCDRTYRFLETLSEAVEAREPNRRGHARRVAFLAEVIGADLGQSELDDLRMAAVLHDLGRIGRYAAGGYRLGQPLRDELAQHPELGALLIKPLGFPECVREAIRFHHHRFDGLGNSGEVSGDEIPLFARILAVADRFDALTRAVHPSQALSPNDAISAMRREQGSRLDPALVEKLATAVSKGVRFDSPDPETLPADVGQAIRSIDSATSFLESDR